MLHVAIRDKREMRTRAVIPATGNSPSIRLYLLGGFRAEVLGTVVRQEAWHRRSAEALVKLLAVSPGHCLHREQIADLLWGDVDLDAASNSLGKALHAARRAFEPNLQQSMPSSYLQRRGEVIILENAWIDADDFQFQAQQTLLRPEIDSCEAVLALYGGELLPDDRYADWAIPRHEALADLVLQLLLAAAGCLEREGDYGPAAERLREALAHDSAREDIHRRLMQVYALAGSRHQALRQYQTCCAIIREELDADPEPETHALYRNIMAGKLSPSAAIPSAPTAPFGLASDSTPPLVGRTDVLEFLRRIWESGLGGCGRVIVVGGEMGVGKTRLVAEFAREVERTDALVLWGGSYEQEGLTPYGPFVEALDDYVAHRSLTTRRHLLARYPQFARLLPSLHLLATDQIVLQTAGDRLGFFASVVGLLNELRGTRPLLMVLEDLHAADGESLQLLAYLARRAAHEPWVLLVTHREEEVYPGSPLQDLSVTLTRQALARRLDLRRLSRSDCDHLVAQVLPDAPIDSSLLEYLYTVSQGNPLLLRQVVQSMREDGTLVRERGYWWVPDPPVTLPQAIQDVVVARVNRMDVEVQRVLALAAVAGIESSFSDLRSAAMRVLEPSFSEDRLLDALDSALQSHVLEEIAGSYRFRHPVLRTALYDRLSHSRRAYLHAALGAAVEQNRPQDIDALAYHFTLSEDVDKAALYLARAADRARDVHAYDAACSYYGELATRLDALGRKFEAARTREKLGDVLSMSGAYDQALDVLEAAAHAYEDMGDPEAQAQVIAQIGHVHFLRGSVGEGKARIRAILGSTVAETGSPAYAEVYSTFARLDHEPTDDQLALAERGTKLASVLGDEAVIKVEVPRALALLRLGRLVEARSLLEGVLPRAERVADHESAFLARGVLSELCKLMGDFQASRSLRATGLAQSTTLALPFWSACMAASLGEILFLLGEWGAARDYFDQAAALQDALASPWLAGFILLGRGLLDLAEGNAECASRQMERCLTESREAGYPTWERNAEQALALRDIAGGVPLSAIERLEPLVVRDGTQHAGMLATLAWAYLETGMDGPAGEHTARAVSRAIETANRLDLGEALMIRGRVEVVQERFDQAAATLKEAVDLARSLPHPYLEARILEIRAVLDIRRAEPEHGLQTLSDALGIFRRLGAQPSLDRVQMVLSHLELP